MAKKKKEKSKSTCKIKSGVDLGGAHATASSPYTPPKNPKKTAEEKEQAREAKAIKWSLRYGIPFKKALELVDCEKTIRKEKIGKGISGPLARMEALQDAFREVVLGTDGRRSRERSLTAESTLPSSGGQRWQSGWDAGVK